MRLLELHVQHFRLHADRRVVFAPGLTVIAGPNESGKSTLVDALRYALFFQARGNSKIHQSFVSARRGGTPQVTLRFEAHGARHTLMKRFGPQGTVTLDTDGRGRLVDDAAERRLEELLRRPTGLGKAEVDLAWTDLLCLQGTSGTDPAAKDTGFARTCTADLFRHLSAGDDGALVASPLDQRVVEDVATRHATLFQDNGKIRLHSRLDAAQRRLEAARNALSGAEAALRDALATIDAITAKEEQLRGIVAELPALRTQLAEARTHVQQVLPLRAALGDRERALAELATQRAHAQETEAQINEARQDHARARERLAPLATRHDEAVAALDAARVTHLQTQGRFAEASDAHRRLLRLGELVAARHKVDAAAVRLEEAKARRAEVEALEAAILKAEVELAGIPAITDKEHRRLSRLREAVRDAEAALRQRAVEVVLEQAAQPLTLGGQPLEAGIPRPVTVEQALEGAGLRVLIRPPAASDANEAQASLVQAREDLRTALQSFGLADFEALAAVASLRAVKVASRDTLAGQRRANEPKASADAVVEAEAALARARQVAEALAQELGEAAQDQAALDAIDTRLAASRELETAARLAWTQAQASLQAAEGGERTAAGHARDASENALRQQARLQALVNQHGNDEDRAEQRINLAAQIQTVEAARDQLRREIAALAPEHWEQVASRLERAVPLREAEEREVALALAGLRGSLQFEGRTDPHGACRIARAEEAAAADELRRAKLEADAVALLHRTIQDLRAKIADRVSKPLRERIGRYLAPVFGEGASPAFVIDAEKFGEMELERPSSVGRFEFKQLSGGTREQVAAAVRLAIAEVLAADHEGCLPVVFDDAFVNSDPGRLGAVQGMLDLAAGAGLQVVVLTCDRTGYTTLPATFVGLDPVAATAAPVPALREPVTSAPADALDEDDDDLDPALPATPATPPTATAEDQAALLDALRAAGGNAGNAALRARLGWDEPRYESAKLALVARGAVTRGRGRGGTLLLA